jgi:hypothetical protein
MAKLVELREITYKIAFATATKVIMAGSFLTCFCCSQHRMSFKIVYKWFSPKLAYIF